jgi:prepilin-type N-terminal cleavage/methylation domain-containing protein
MKLQVPFSGSGRGRSSLPVKGFTLPEVLIAMTVFILVVAGIITANLFGLKMFQVNTTKLNVTTWSLDTIEKITAEVHACDSMWVGNITNGVFEGLLDGETQQGTALLIYPTANTNNYIMYFVDPFDQTFRRTTDQAGTAEILAGSITNITVFAALNFSGTVMTNNNNYRVIHLTLEFNQPARFALGADYYKLETSMTRRVVQ